MIWLSKKDIALPIFHELYSLVITKSQIRQKFRSTNAHTGRAVKAEEYTSQRQIPQ